MTFEISCPNCGSDEHLTGRPEGDLIRIACAPCELEWLRDPAPRCPTCDSAEVRPVARAVVEKSRGTQLSIMALEVVYLCPDCDRDALRRQQQTNSPLPPRENPASDAR